MPTTRSDLTGTRSATFRILNALFDAAGLTASRTLTVPDANGTVLVLESSGTVALDASSGDSNIVTLQADAPTGNDVAQMRLHASNDVASVAPYAAFRLSNGSLLRSFIVDFIAGPSWNGDPMFHAGNLLDIGTTPGDARTALELNTAAQAMIGTSGGTVPLLNGNNTHSGLTTFTYSGAGGADSPIVAATSSGGRIGWAATSQGADGKNWDIAVAGATMVCRTVNDANNAAAIAWRVTRSANTVTSYEVLTNGTVRITVSNTGLACSGAVTSSSASAGIGYATGAGGAVTQATSKSTGVTSNAASVQITMNNASLAAGAVVGFTLTNSAIGANDTPIAVIKSGGSNDAYGISVTAVAAGSCRISIRNNTGGALGEPLVLQVNVIKGVTS